MNIGARIKMLRKSKGITQKQLADNLHMSKRNIEKYENNEINISINTLVEIAASLDVSLIEILVDDPADLLGVIKDYYNLEDKSGYNIENDFEMIMQGLSAGKKSSLWRNKLFFLIYK